MSTANPLIQIKTSIEFSLHFFLDVFMFLCTRVMPASAGVIVVVCTETSGLCPLLISRVQIRTDPKKDQSVGEEVSTQCGQYGCSRERRSCCDDSFFPGQAASRKIMRFFKTRSLFLDQCLCNQAMFVFHVGTGLAPSILLCSPPSFGRTTLPGTTEADS